MEVYASCDLGYSDKGQIPANKECVMKQTSHREATNLQMRPFLGPMLLLNRKQKRALYDTMAEASMAGDQCDLMLS